MRKTSRIWWKTMMVREKAQEGLLETQTGITIDSKRGFQFFLFLFFFHLVFLFYSYISSRFFFPVLASWFFFFAHFFILFLPLLFLSLLFSCSSAILRQRYYTPWRAKLVTMQIIRRLCYFTSSFCFPFLLLAFVFFFLFLYFSFFLFFSSTWIFLLLFSSILWIFFSSVEAVKLGELSRTIRKSLRYFFIFIKSNSLKLMVCMYIYRSWISYIFTRAHECQTRQFLISLFLIIYFLKFFFTPDYKTFTSDSLILFFFSLNQFNVSSSFINSPLILKFLSNCLK